MNTLISSFESSCGSFFLRPKHTRRPTLAQLIVAGVLVAAPVLCFGQATAAPASQDNEILTLSPFEVTSTSDTGYEVKQTLAGSRLRSELKDVGASITILSKEFIDDLGASSLMELADFLPSTEQEITSVSGTTASTPIFRAQSFRIRGLFTESIARNFFTGLVGEHMPPQDGFNADDVTLSAGANSILFGSANPAGIINTQTTRAKLGKDSYQVRHRTDNYGTLRLESTANKVLIKDKLAVQLALLHEEREFFRRPQWLDQQRLYSAVAWKPFKNTKVDANFEYIDFARNSPIASVLNDGLSSWIVAGKPTIAVNGTTNPATITGLRNAGTANTTRVIFGSAGAMNLVQNWRNYAISNFNGIGVTGANASLPLDFMEHEQNFVYDTRLDDRHARIGDVSIEQRLAPNLHMQLAAFWSKHRKDIWFANNFNQVNVDASQTLLDGSPNPNVGRYFINSSSAELRDFLYEDTSYRWTAAYERDLRDINKWLGRHQLVTLAQYSEGVRYTDRARIVNVTPLPGFNTSILNAQNNLQPVFYVDLAGGVRRNGQTLDPREWTRYFSSLNGINADLVRTIAGTSTKTLQSAYLLGGQSHWLSDRLVTTFGYRIDSQDVDEISAADWPRSARGDYVPFREVTVPRKTNAAVSNIREGTYSVGGVAHILNNWRWIDRLSLTYNTSTNFEPSPASINFQGTPPPAATGKTEDIGIGFALFGGKLNGRVSRFEGGQTNARSTGISTSVEDRMNAIWNTLADTVDASLRSRVTQLASNAETRDEDTKGLEFSLTYSPLRNWRLMLNGSRNEAVRANQSPSTRKYMADNFPSLQQNYANVQIPTQQNRTVSELIALMNEQAELESLNDGLKANELREWKFSVLTNYDFKTGPLKGFGIGGYINWQDKAAIGYARDGNNRLDKTHPFFGDPIVTTGLNVSYSRRVFGDRVMWKIQLNVRNLLDADNYIGISAVEERNTDNLPVISTYRIQEPRSAILSNTFSF